MVQFIYGEDGMTGEMIEDLKIDLVKLSNSQIRSKYMMFDDGKSGKERSLEDQLKKAVTPDVLHEIS